MEIATFRLKVWFLSEYLMFSSNILAQIISTREKVSDTRTGETHWGGILLEESTKIELLLPGKLWDNTARSLFSPLSRVRLVTFAANHVRDLIYAGHMVDKTKYVIAVLRSISNFIVLQNDRLFNYIKKKEKKTEKTNLIHSAQNLTFRCSTLNALSRNYDICISHGKNLSKRRLVRKFQPTNFESKPKTEGKDQLYI